MQELNDTGKYKIDNPLKKKLDKIFYADFATEEETLQMIKETFVHFKYLVDTHTAVALSVVSKYRRATKDLLPVLVASTASPFKFTSAVLNALGESTEGIDDLAQLDRLSLITNRPIPKNLATLDKAKILHESVCDKEEMAEQVLKFAGSQS